MAGLLKFDWPKFSKLWDQKAGFLKRHEESTKQKKSTDTGDVQECFIDRNIW